MKDPCIVLREKEQDLARVRAEIQALLTVIPLLDDSAPSWSEPKVVLTSEWDLEQFPDGGITDLERYFPFVRNLRKSG
ncbi:MAG: hypothetical protein JO266_04550 [Acidobacteria bacterium]|nr:hypothetical protein [Acidobacteriota bacterium]MBV9483846.1 hypothetical protein [Acidobacteriota bacterium]